MQNKSQFSSFFKLLPAIIITTVVAVLVIVYVSFHFQGSVAQPELEDIDEDGVPDLFDNCREVYNPKQYDFDQNDIGDVCESNSLYKEEEILFVKYDTDNECDEPFSENCERETIILSGDINFDFNSEENNFSADMELEGESDFFGDLELEGNGSFQYSEKFSGLEFPADAEFYKTFELDSDEFGRLYSSYGFNFEFSSEFNKEEEGIIKRFPPLWGDPLCWIADPDSEGQSKQPIGVYSSEWNGEEEEFILLGWIIKNCDQYWWRDYYDGQDSPPSVGSRNFPPELLATNFDSEMEISWSVPGAPETLVLSGPTRVSGTREEGVFETEILSMNLTGGGISLQSGSGSGHLTPIFDGTLGGSDGEFNAPQLPADSFFDVFFDIAIPDEQAEGGLATYHPWWFDQNENEGEGEWMKGVHLTARVKEIPWLITAHCYQDEDNNGNPILLFTSSEANPNNDDEPDGQIYKICLELIAEQPELDFGDAPDDSELFNYRTLLSNNGARHIILPEGPVLGEQIDAESDGQPSLGADGDDNNGDDEDGVLFETDLVVGGEAQIVVLVSDPNNEGGFLNAWIDFNQDGDWDEVGEQIINGQGVPSGSNEIDFEIPLNAFFGKTYARFRISTEEELSYFGLADNGEVEDYLVSISPLLPESFTDNFHFSIGENNILTITNDQDGRPVVSLPSGANTSDISVETEEDSDKPGVTIISGVTLPEGQTKTIFINANLDSNLICLVDEPVVSASQVSVASAALCQGLVISCPGSTGQYSCEKIEGQYAISGLVNSGGGELPPPPPLPIPSPSGGITFQPGTFEAPESAPGGSSVMINSGAVKTLTREVTLTFRAGANVKKFAVSNNPNFSGAILEDFGSSVSKAWQLTAGTGLKTVYAKFYTAYGQSSGVVSDSILYEPTGVSAEAPVSEGVLVPGFQFKKNLRYGQKHSDVLELQKFLNKKGFMIASSGPGSAGEETDYFGLLTFNALIKFQEFYAADILTPVGLKKGTGFFGSSSRSKANSF